MKRSLLLLLLSSFFCVYFTVSCTKSSVAHNIYDTTVVKDTLIIKDTTVVKDTVVVGPHNPITGLWVGSYFINGDAVDSFTYQFDIRSDSTIYTIGSGTNQTAGYASGPWHLSGTAFTAYLTSMDATQPENTQTVTATYDSVSGRLYNGTWVDTRGNGGQTGTFMLKRIQ